MTVASLNPPVAMVPSPLSKLELASRLVIGLALAVHGGGRAIDPNNIKQLHILRTSLASFLPTARPAYTYRYVLSMGSGCIAEP